MSCVTVSKHFSIINRCNGTWCLFIKGLNDRSDGFGYINYKDLIEYINEFSVFLDEEVFKNDAVCYRLNTGSTWGDIADYFECTDVNEDVRTDISKVYRNAQAWVDNKVKYNTDIELNDIRQLTSLIYGIHETNNVDAEHRIRYNKILQLLIINEEFKEL